MFLAQFIIINSSRTIYSIVASSEQTAISIGTTAINWSISGNPFTVAGDVLSWTAFTVYQNGTANAIASGSLTVTPTTLTYFYFNPTVSTTVLQSTTVTATAVGPGTYPIATFDGVNLKGGDGSAFISGSQVLAGTLAGSAIVAGSILATQLSTSTAVITTSAQIAAAIIDSVSIKNHIQSANYSTTLFTGFTLETGNSGGTPALNMYAGSFNLYDTTGSLIFSASNGFDGAYIKHATIDTAQIKNAAVGALQLAGYMMTIPAVFVLATSYGIGGQPSATWITIPNFSLTINNPGNNSGNNIEWYITAGLVGTVIGAYLKYCRILFDGIPVNQVTCNSDPYSSGTGYLTPCSALVKNSTVGNHTITVQVYCTGQGLSNIGYSLSQGSSISAVGAMG